MISGHESSATFRQKVKESECVTVSTILTSNVEILYSEYIRQDKTSDVYSKSFHETKNENCASFGLLIMFLV